ncbi:MAG: hypothetical protein WBN04_10080 [Paracoccaceae bacterium]
MSKTKAASDAWNPGLSSELPSELLPLVTLYTPENSDVGYQEAKEAADFCGLKPQDMIAFKVSRLAVHEVLIRVTSDLFVPDGPSYEELGLNLRSMAERILDGHVRPRLDELETAFSAIRSDAQKTLAARLEADIFGPASPPQPAAKPNLLARLIGNKTATKPLEELPELRALSRWQEQISTTKDALELACLKALHTIVGGIVGQRGRLMADKDLIVRLASNLVCNSYGSQRIGELIEPMVLKAAEAEGYRLLPYQKAPFVMNVKGASAAGKSTIRPLQRELAERLGIPWQDFALVSPDYWRKFLLDYDSLGDDFKYAAMLTGQELEIIDKKLDRYMESKAARGQMPHLLIDRFRFDSFVSSPKQQADGHLLSRFGETVFIFFMITPPPETVERAWQRGLKTGRFKAVDDLLYHNIEAYTGMPQLFFTWANKERQKIHFEFLDNSVPYGQRPRTAAFGWNGQLNVLDIDCMRSLNRYQRINIDARRPEDVFEKPTGPEQDFLAECIQKIPDVNFVDPGSLKVLGRTHNGVRVAQSDAFFQNTGLASAVRSDSSDKRDDPKDHPPLDVAHEKKFTVGDWGD